MVVIPLGAGRSVLLLGADKALGLLSRGMTPVVKNAVEHGHRCVEAAWALWGLLSGSRGTGCSSLDKRPRCLALQGSLGQGLSGYKDAVENGSRCVEAACGLWALVGRSLDSVLKIHS